MSNSISKRNIFILGGNTDFVEQVMDAFTERGSKFFSYTYTFGDWNELFDNLKIISFDMLIVDFSSIKDCESLISYSDNIVRVKQSEILSKLPLIGLFENKEQISTNNFLKYCGVNYYHIIGDDFNLFFGNIYYIAFEDENYFLKLARAYKLKLELELKHNCPIQDISRFQMIINSDITFDDEITGTIHEEFGNKGISFEVVDVKSQAGIGPNDHSYEVDLVFEEGGWEEGASDINIEEAPVLAQDFEAWVDNLDQDDSYSKKKEVKVFCFSKKPTWFFHLISEKKPSDVQVNTFLTFDEIEIGRYDTPDFIILDCLDDEDLDSADTLMNYYCNSRDQPIILLLNHPSKAQAIQKMYGYESVLVYSEAIRAATFDQMLAMIKGNKSEPKDFLKLNNLAHSQVFKLPVPIKVTSLTENEVTFTCAVEIPFFSHMCLIEGDFEVDLVIVPSFLKLSPNIHGFHYMGLVNGSTEADRQKIRGIVKKFVDQHPESWDGVTLFGEHGDMVSVDREEDVIEAEKKAKEKEKEDLVTKSIEDKNVKKRARIGSSKSKL